jgi:alkylhydroperoxidase family enzyme
MPRKAKHEGRLAPVTPPYDSETASALAALGPPITLFRVFARRPDLARAMQGWGSYYLSRRAALSLRHRELIIDRTTALCGAEYEWAIHVAAYASKAGLSDEHVASLAHGEPEDACWAPAERAVLRAVDALHASFDLTEECWVDLVAATSEDGALEAVLLCGWYHAISFAVRALRLPSSPEPPAFRTGNGILRDHHGCSRKSAAGPVSRPCA